MMGSEAEDLTLEMDDSSNDNELQENLSSDCFFSPGRRRFVPFLDIRFVDGDSLGLRYTHIDALLFTGGKSITIISPLYRVKLEGRNLKTLYQRLLTESVIWIAELPEEQDTLAASAVVVNSIRLVSSDEMQD